jgi:hypothetical protein
VIYFALVSSSDQKIVRGGYLHKLSPGIFLTDDLPSDLETRRPLEGSALASSSTSQKQINYTSRRIDGYSAALQTSMMPHHSFNVTQRITRENVDLK